MDFGYSFFYVEANIVCILFFLIILVRNIKSIDRQMKQMVFDRVLVCHALYCISDSFWVLIIAGFIVKNMFTVAFFNISNAVILSYLAYNWFVFVEVSQKSAYILKPRVKAFVQIPIFVSFVLITGLFLFNPGLAYAEDMMPSGVYYALFMIVPISYIIVAVVRAFMRALDREYYAERHQYIVYGLYPIAVAFFGILQVIWIKAPLFCFGCAIMFIYVYLMSLDNLISLDPLTNLNNRNQLKKYVSVELKRYSNKQQPYYVMMLDLNKFKEINDKYGHAEGDEAIQNASSAIKEACNNSVLHPFVARYGGDEFIIIAKTDSEKEIKELQLGIQNSFDNINKKIQKPYVLHISIGYAKAESGSSDFEAVKKEADKALYRSKEEWHSRQKSVLRKR